MTAQVNKIAKIKALLQRIFADAAQDQADQKGLSQEQSQQLELAHLVELISPRSYFTKTMLVWNIALFSLPIDLLFANRASLQLGDPDALLYVLYALTGVALLGLVPEQVMSWIDRLRAKPGETSSSWQRTIAPAAILLLLAFGKVLYQLSALGLMPFLIVTALIVIALPKHIKTFKAMRDTFSKLNREPVLLIQQINFQVMLIVVLPIIAARMLSVVAALNTHLSADSYQSYVSFALVALILLLVLKPNPALFSAKCLRCAAWTPRAVRYLGYCPACSFENFIPKPIRPEEALLKEQSDPQESATDYTNRERRRSQKPRVVDAGTLLKELFSKVGSTKSPSSKRKLPHKTFPADVDTTSSTNKH